MNGSYCRGTRKRIHAVELKKRIEKKRRIFCTEKFTMTRSDQVEEASSSWNMKTKLPQRGTLCSDVLTIHSIPYGAAIDH